eukprot:CAMPEP_0118723338 /NCGR_PEP_ID=MMETSP0800-20121206/31949_1 /TAXON_ID=210618 ORGANISM="Striatella unipunctata, Strain CCMP2910" /NCGR_SAMPLE_ID=MMETSP0800 /ASSEMBLY_ACC=CAM_ASM_000638 /LENGTH=107 /DNA_ID=CAMNT_0006631755 /DNA_START=188 /DNA_END=511 /DNA_ORIENTATION=-
MILVYWSVKKQQNSRRRFSFGQQQPQKRRLESEVAKQAFFYLLGFYLSSPPLIIAAYIPNPPFWVSLTAYTVYPMQGFFNFIVYTRPEYEKSRRRKLRLSVSQQAAA